MFTRVATLLGLAALAAAPLRAQNPAPQAQAVPGTVRVCGQDVPPALRHVDGLQARQIPWSGFRM